jgi:hypothetical protein
MDASLVVLVTPAVGPAGHSAGMTNGGSGHADTTNSGPAWAASQANLRDHAVRLRKWRWCYCLRRSCDDEDKASSSDQPNHLLLPCYRTLSFKKERAIPSIIQAKPHYKTTRKLRWFDSRCCAILGSATGMAGIPACGRLGGGTHTHTPWSGVPPLPFFLHNDTARMLRNYYSCGSH